MSNLYLSATSDKGSGAKPVTRQGNYEMDGWVGGFEGVMWFSIYEPRGEQRDKLNFFGRFFIRIDMGPHPHIEGEQGKPRFTIYDGPLDCETAGKFWNHPTNPHLLTEVVTDWESCAEEVSP